MSMWRTVEEAADLAGKSPKTIRRWLRSGQYVTRRPGPGPCARIWVLVDDDGFPVKRPE